MKNFFSFKNYSKVFKKLRDLIKAFRDCLDYDGKFEGQSHANQNIVEDLLETFQSLREAGFIGLTRKEAIDKVGILNKLILNKCIL